MRGLICFFLSLSFCSVYSQDIHFSQFFFAPQLLSPAEIGNFNAQYRFNANQKTQWREVTRPYSTFALSGDGSFDFTPKNISLGAVIMNDRAGDSRFNTFSLLFGGAYLYVLEEDDRHSFRGGLQTGLTQIRLNYDNLSFDNQYNGIVYDPQLPTGEDFPRNSRWYLNLNLGVTYQFEYAENKIISAGYAAHNVSAPKQSFYNDTGIRLPLRSSFYVMSSWMINDDFTALPAFRWMDQATFSEVILGSAVRYTLLKERSLYRAVFAGYFGRFGDSGIAMLGVEYDAWRFAASYDINVSELEMASRNQGGFEFSLQYLFNREVENKLFRHKYCPVFL